MTNIMYERQGSYVQAKEDVALAMLAEGLPIEMIVRVTRLSKQEVVKLKRQAAKEPATA